MHLPIAFDDDAQSGGRLVDELTYSHTCTGSDLILLVSANLKRLGSETVTGVTYDGVALTLIDSDVGGQRYASLWYLVGPATGANDIVVSVSQTVQSVDSGSISLTGVDQSVPLGTANTANGSGTAPSVTVSAATDDLVVDALCIENAGTLSVGASQTQRYNAVGADGWNKRAGSTEPGAASVTMSWSDTVGGQWAIVAVPVKPKAAAGGSAIPVIAMQYRMRRAA
jgi:hypothetical protein